MSTFANLFLLRETEDGAELYLGDFTTAQGLALIPEQTPIEVTAFGATLMRDHSWATAEHLPPLETAGELAAFLNEDDDIGLVDFEARLLGIGTMSSHDDGECTYKLESAKLVASIVQGAADPRFYGKLLQVLRSHPGQYVSCGDEGEIDRFATFDDYLRAI